jgi:hypothetical protein
VTLWKKFKDLEIKKAGIKIVCEGFDTLTHRGCVLNYFS